METFCYPKNVDHKAKKEKYLNRFSTGRYCKCSQRCDGYQKPNQETDTVDSAICRYASQHSWSIINQLFV